jgi:CRISPR-associated protein Cas1
MIKRTLLFGNPAYLRVKNLQLHVSYPGGDKKEQSVPIEDVGMVILEHQQITITNDLLGLLAARNIAVVYCDSYHMPSGWTMPFSGHTQGGQRFQSQLAASQPLKKNLWQQTIKAKIKNQAYHLKTRDLPHNNMIHWATETQSGDAKNHEARAAAHYWPILFKEKSIDFRRGRELEAPNNLLNYGYAILRAICCRALVGSGLLPIMGIFHSNKYNSFPLADDIMEPYRPFVDTLVCTIVDNHDDYDELSVELKKHLLGLPTMDVLIDQQNSPLMVAMSRTTNSLAACFLGTQKKMLFPEFIQCNE